MPAVSSDTCVVCSHPSATGTLGRLPQTLAGTGAPEV
jgi:hypothetical protein